MFYPRFKSIPFINGHKCDELKGQNLLIALINDLVISNFRKRFLNYTQKKDYDHAQWLKILVQQEVFRSIIEMQHPNFEFIIPRDSFQLILQKGLDNHLNRAEYDFLWKLISLKATLNWESI